MERILRIAISAYLWLGLLGGLAIECLGQTYNPSIPVSESDSGMLTYTATVSSGGTCPQSGNTGPSQNITQVVFSGFAFNGQSLGAGSSITYLMMPFVNNTTPNLPGPCPVIGWQNQFSGTNYSLSTGTGTYYVLFTPPTPPGVGNVTGSAVLQALSVSASPNPGTWATTSTITATATFPSQSGTVTYTDAGANIGTATMTNSVANLSISTLSVGTHALSATFTNSAGLLTAPTVNYVVNKAPQTITFTAPTTPVRNGVAPISLSATASSGLGVTFSVVSGPGSISGNTLTITGSGTVLVAANQAGNSDYLAAPQVEQTIVVEAGTVTQVSSNLNPAVATQGVVLSALINTGGSSPTGSVVFENNGTSIGTGAVSVISTTNLLPWSSNLNDWNVSGNPTVTQNGDVAPDGSYTAALIVGGSAAGSVYTSRVQSSQLTLGSSYTFSAWMRVTSGQQIATIDGSGTDSIFGWSNYLYAAPTLTTQWQRIQATGVVPTTDTNGLVIYINNPNQGVTFEVWGAQLELGTTPGPYVATTSSFATGSGGSASLNVGSVSGGSQSITASYTGDSVDFSSSSSALTQINAASTFTEIYTALSPAVVNQNVRVKATVSSGGSVTPTGTVLFSSNGVAVGTQMSLTPVTTKNLLKWSSSFLNWYTTNSPTVTPNAAMAPDGSNTATTVVGGSSAGQLYTWNIPNSQISLAHMYTLSVWMKVTSGSQSITMTAGGHDSITGFTAYLNSTSMVNTTWQRIQATGFVPGTDTNGLSIFMNWFQPGVTYEIWGAQLEQASYPGPYVATGWIAQTGSGASAVMTTPYLTQGANSLQATYAGDANNSPSTSLPLSLNVSSTLQTVTFPTLPTPVAFGTAPVTLSATASSGLPITYSVSGPATISGTTLTFTGVGTVKVTATQVGTTTYGEASEYQLVQVNQAIPVIVWPAPPDISSGTALSSTQLDATSATAGSFTYTPAAGTVLPVGPQTLSAVFTPTDPVDYATSLATSYVNVTPDTNVWDTGSVTLTVNSGTVMTVTAPYGQTSTPSSIAAALAAASSGSQIKVTAVDDTLDIEATGTGTASDVTYSITNTYNTSKFSAPSFEGSPASGSLSGGGAAQGSGSTTPVYSYSLSYDATSNVHQVTDSVMGNWINGYDTLNRLTSGVASTGPFSGQDLCWAYDPFGNRTMQTMQTSSCSTGMPATMAYNVNNQISSGLYSYDPVGEVTADAQGNQYLYDAEGRICAVRSAPYNGNIVLTGYLYDAEGTRVAKGTISVWSCDAGVNGFSTTNDYILGPGGEQVTELGVGGASSGSTATGMVWQHTNVWAGGKLLATYDGATVSGTDITGGLHFYFDDWIGSRRVQTDYAGNIEKSCASLPYGDQESCAPTPTEHLFTGKERDAESGNDYFGARYYAYSMGRFMSSDPLPWIHWQQGNKNDREKFAAYIANPQNFDLYAYVLNNPLSKTDPTGMYVCDGGQQQCQAVQNSLNAVKSAAEALSKGNATEQALGKKLDAILSFYGKAGVDNGVNVGFANLGPGVFGKTEGGLFSTRITFDNNAFNHSYSFGAETVAHEGAHGIDNHWGLSSYLWGNQLSTETHAYQAESAVDRGLGAVSGATPLQVWNPVWRSNAEGLSSDAINFDATINAHSNCGGGCLGEPNN